MVGKQSRCWRILAISLALCGCEKNPKGKPAPSAGNAAAMVGPSEADQAAAEALEKLGYILGYNPQMSGSSVEVVDFRGLPVTPEALALLKELENLLTVELSGTDINDDGLKSLHELKRLEHIFLKGTPISDVGLQSLRGLPRVQTLDLTDTAVTDAGATDLASLQSLTALYLGNTRIGDAGLEALKGLGNLQRLDVSRVAPPPPAGAADTAAPGPESAPMIRVTDAGLSSVANFQGLTFLKLSGNAISDAGLEQLAGLTNLQQLSLDRTKISDAGLDHLVGLIKLSFLDVYQTGVTKERAADLKSDNPRLSINFDP